MKNGRRAGAKFATEAFFGASEPGALWAYVGEAATSIDARQTATSVPLSAGAETVAMVIAAAKATPLTGAGIWLAYPLIHQQLAQRALRLIRSLGAALRMSKQMCVRTFNAQGRGSANVSRDPHGTSICPWSVCTDNEG